MTTILVGRLNFQKMKTFFFLCQPEHGATERGIDPVCHIQGKFHSQSLLLLDLSVPDQIVRAAKQ